MLKVFFVFFYLTRRFSSVKSSNLKLMPQCSNSRPTFFIENQTSESLWFRKYSIRSKIFCIFKPHDLCRYFWILPYKIWPKSVVFIFGVDWISELSSPINLSFGLNKGSANCYIICPWIIFILQAFTVYITYVIYIQSMIIPMHFKLTSFRKNLFKGSYYMIHIQKFISQELQNFNFWRLIVSTLKVLFSFLSQNRG